METLCLQYLKWNGGNASLRKKCMVDKVQAGRKVEAFKAKRLPKGGAIDPDRWPECMEGVPMDRQEKGAEIENDADGSCSA